MFTFNLSIITAEGQVYSNAVKFVTAPGQAGYVGILANHAPLMSLLRPGVIKIVEPENQELYAAVDTGVVEVNDKHEVLILGGHAFLTANEKEAHDKALSFVD